MKHLWVRLTAALSVCLWTVTAFAADVVTDISQGPVQHPILAIVAATSATITRMLQSDVSWAPTRLLRYRLLVILGLSTLGSWVDMVQHATGYTAALYAIGLTAVPSLVVEIFHLFSKAGKGGTGSSSADLSDVAPSKSAQPSSYSAKMMGLALAFGLLLPGCVGAIPKILTVIADVTSIVQEAQSLAASARDEESQYFLRHPNAEAQAKVESALSDVEQSLAAFSRASKGVTEASLGQLDAAQADFVLAWKKLEGVLRDLGVMHGNKIAASPGAAPTEIREPLLLTAKLHS